MPVEFLNAFLPNVRVTKDNHKLYTYVDLFCDMLKSEEDLVSER